MNYQQVRTHVTSAHTHTPILILLNQIHSAINWTRTQLAEDASCSSSSSSSGPSSGCSGSSNHGGGSNRGVLALVIIVA